MIQKKHTDSAITDNSVGGNSQTSLTVLACQLDIPLDMQSPDERNLHLERTAELLDNALTKRSADVVLLPELSSISYTRHCFSKPAQFAEGPMGISYEKLSPVAQKHGVTLLYGAPRLSEEGRLSICQFVIGPDGLPRGFYDKMHLAHYGASMEKDYFSAGEHLSVFRVKGLSFAPLICYDLRFPELASTLALQHSVDAVLHAVAFYRDESFHSWHAFAVARAMENQFYWLSLNRAGTQFGGSIFCQPWVDEDTASVTLGLAEELVWFEVDTAVMARVRAAYTFGRDRLGNYATIPVNQA